MTVIAVRTRGTKGALEWMRRALPRTYQHLDRELRNASSTSGMKGLGLVAPTVATAASEAPPSSSLVNTIKEIANVAAQAYLTREQMQAQQKILNLQLQRAQQGLPPLALDPTTYGLPQPSIGVGLDAGTTKTLLWVGGGLALALLFGLIGGGRAARR